MMLNNVGIILIIQQIYKLKLLLNKSKYWFEFNYASRLAVGGVYQSTLINNHYNLHL